MDQEANSGRMKVKIRFIRDTKMSKSLKDLGFFCDKSSFKRYTIYYTSGTKIQLNRHFLLDMNGHCDASLPCR